VTRLIDQEQENLWDSVQILSQINAEKAKAVFKVTIEKSLQQLGITSPIFQRFLCLYQTQIVFSNSAESKRK
jgi:hypothetical protein